MTLEESVRWLYRHQAGLSFDRNDEGEDIITVIVALRAPDGQTAKAQGPVRSQKQAEEKFVKFVAALSEQLNYE